MELNMQQQILMRCKHWMLWFWPYMVAHPRWGIEHGTDGRSHWLWLWCVQVWWHNSSKCPTGNNTAPMRDGGRNVRGRE